MVVIIYGVGRFVQEKCLSRLAIFVSYVSNLRIVSENLEFPSSYKYVIKYSLLLFPHIK